MSVRVHHQGAGGKHACMQADVLGIAGGLLRRGLGRFSLYPWGHDFRNSALLISLGDEGPEKKEGREKALWLFRAKCVRSAGKSHGRGRTLVLMP